MQPAYGVVPLLLIAVAAIAVLLVLISVVKLHAFLSLVLVSLLVGLTAGIPLDQVADTLLDGFGETLAEVGLLVALGAMIGRLLEVTGGAQVLANTLVVRFGARRAPLALGIAAMFFGFPIFLDAAFVVFLPIIFSVARRFGGSLLFYALPAAGAFGVMHAFAPPHPGPVASSELLGADVGLVVLAGIALAIPTWYLGAYLFSKVLAPRLHVPVPALGKSPEQHPQHELPRFATVLIILLLPLGLIFLNTGLNTLGTAGVVDAEATWVRALQLIGETPVALLATALLSVVVLGRGRSRAEVERIANESLGPVCSIILITGAGGMFGAVLRASGVGQALAGSLHAAGLPLVVAGFVIAVGMRVAQGSATVALTTTAGLIAPTVAVTGGITSLDRVLVVLAMACGATVLSHVNDSAFWLVGRFLDMDVKTTLKTWTTLETLLGGIGFALVLLASALT